MMKRKKRSGLKFNPELALVSLQTTWAQKLRNAVEQDDASAFTKAVKLKSGQECAHKFNEKCFGVLTTLKPKILESLRKVQTFEIKERRCTLQPKEDMHPKGEGKKKIESNKKSAKLGVKRKIVKEFFH